MAARENQGYLIAVIILVLLTLILALAAFLGLSKASENSDIKTNLQQELDFTKSLSSAYEIEADILMALAGDFGPSVAEVQTSIDSLNRLATSTGLDSAQQQQIQAIIDQVKLIKSTYDKDMVGSTTSAEDGAPAQQPTWREKIRNLIAIVATKNKEYNIQVNATRQAEEEATSKIAQMQKTLDASLKTQQELSDELAVVKKTALETETQLKGDIELAQQDNENFKGQYQAFQQKSNEEIRGLENDVTIVNEENEKLKTKINRYEREVFDRPDGQIVRVASGLKTVIIDLGSDDGLTNNRTFAIYDQSVTNFEQGNHKATIEVTQVSPNKAQARITEENPSNPILTGDYILTATWDPGFSVPIALAGRFDLDGDIYDDTDKLVQMIKRNGGTVVARHDGEGNIQGKMDANVRYFVKGDPPIAGAQAEEGDKRNTVAIVQAMQEMEKMAEQNTIQVIGLQKLLNRMGVRGKPKTTQIEDRMGGFDTRPSDSLKDPNR